MLSAGLVLSLWDVLNKPRETVGALWNINGTSFTVVEPKPFIECIRARECSVETLESFVAQLKSYGFIQCSVQSLEFSHAFFLRDDTSKLNYINKINGHDLSDPTDNSLLVGMMKMLVSTMTSFSEQITHLQSEVEEYKTVLDCSTRAAEIRYESLAEKHKNLKKEVKELRNEKSNVTCTCYQRRVSSSLQMDGLNKRIKEKFVGINAMQLTHSKLTNPQVIDELLRKRLIPLLFLLNNKFQQGIEYFLHPCRPPAPGQKSVNTVISPSSTKTVKNATVPEHNLNTSESASVDNMSTNTSGCIAPINSTLMAIESVLAKEATAGASNTSLSSQSLLDGNDQRSSTVSSVSVAQSDNVWKSVVIGKPRPILPQGVVPESRPVPNTMTSSVNAPQDPNFIRDLLANRDSIKALNKELQTQKLRNAVNQNPMSRPVSNDGPIMVSVKPILSNHGKVFPSFTTRKATEPNILKRPSDSSLGNPTGAIEAKRQKSNSMVPKIQAEPTQSTVTLSNLVKSALSRLSTGQQSQTKPAPALNIMPPYVVSVKKPTPLVEKAHVQVKEEPSECSETSSLIDRPPLQCDLSNENNRNQVSSNVNSKIKVVKSCSLAAGNLSKGGGISKANESNSEIPVKEEPLDPDGTSLNCNEIMETSNPDLRQGDNTNPGVQENGSRNSESVLNNSMNSDDISPFLMQF